MPAFLAPAVLWSSKLKFAQKFSVIMVLAIVPLCIISFLTFQRLVATIDTTESKLAGLESIAPMQTLLQKLPEHHSLSVRVKASAQSRSQSSGQASKKGLSDLQQEIQAEIDKLNRLPKSLMLHQADIESAASQWQNLQQQLEQLKLSQNQVEHQHLLQLLEAMLNTAGTGSKLLLDQSVLNHLLVKLQLQQLHRVTILSHQLYGAGLSITLAGRFSPDSYLSLQSNYQALQVSLEQLTLSQAMLDDYADYQSSDLAQALSALLNTGADLLQAIKRNMLDADQLAMNTAELDALVEAVIKANANSQQSSVHLLTSRLKQELNNERLERNIIVGLMLATVVLSVYLITAIYISLKNDLKLLSCHADAMSHGDFSQVLNMGTRDEIGDIGRDFEHMRQEVASLIKQVLGSLETLLEAAGSLHQNMQASHGAINGQRQETDHLAGSIQELSATVADVVGNTQSAEQTAQEAQQLAQQGQSRVAATSKEIHQLAQEVELANSTISSLHQDSENIGGVLDVIKGIAEQTNLLALNAAIEAARAGEQGRGFAVVADEVRSLAVKTQDSTEEIQRMIEVLQKGTQDAVAVMKRGFGIANDGVERADEAAQALANINQSVDAILHKSQGIAAATQQQSQLANVILSNTQNIRDQAGDLLSQADAASAAGQEQEALANELNQLLGRFKV